MSKNQQSHGNKPFISYDGEVNGVRAEVKVYTGFAPVDSIKRAKKSDSDMRQVVFHPENADYPTSGWSKSGTDFFDAVEDIKDSGEFIHYRIEVQRKNDVDREKTIDEITGAVNGSKPDTKMSFENTFRRFVGFRRDGEEDWTFDKEYALTDPSEDPVSGGASALSQSPSQRNKSKNQDSGGGSVKRDIISKLAFERPIKAMSFVSATLDRLNDGFNYSTHDIKTLATAVLEASEYVQTEMFEKVNKEPEVDYESASFDIAFECVKQVTSHGEYVVGASRLGEDGVDDDWLDNVINEARKLYMWSIKYVSAE